MKQATVTIITPIAPHHQKQFVRCADSVRAQTVQCVHLHMVDTAKRGPGHIRNELLKQVKTQYVVFLDADDYLEPEFIDQCLRHVSGHNYVYTDWYQGTRIMSTPDGAFWDVAWHLVTCLLHTDMVRLVGGFDETLPVMEDTKLFLEFDKYDYCGIKVPFPLVHYTGDGKRGKEGHESGNTKKVKAQFTREFHVGCCGKKNDGKINRTPVGTHLPDDVLVMALWVGNRKVIGAATGRRYPRASRPKRLWMHKDDAKLHPNLFKVIPQTKPKATPKKVVRQPAKPAQKLNALQQMLVDHGVVFAQPELPVIPVADGIIKPDFIKLNLIAKGIYPDVKAKKARKRKSKASPVINSKAVEPTNQPVTTVRT